MKAHSHFKITIYFMFFISTAAYAVDETYVVDHCSTDKVTPVNQYVLKTLSGREYTDLIVNLRILNRFRKSAESNELSRKYESIVDGSKTVTVNCSNGGSVVNTIMGHSSGYQSIHSDVKECDLNGNIYEGSYLTVMVPTKYSEITDINMTIKNNDGGDVSFSNAEYRVDFSDHYLNEEYKGVKTFKYKNMKKRVNNKNVHQVSNYRASVGWSDRYQDTSQLHTFFELDISGLAETVEIFTERPIVIDGRLNSIKSGKITVSNRASNNSSSQNRGESRSEIAFTNMDRRMKECLRVNLPL